MRRFFQGSSSQDDEEPPPFKPLPHPKNATSSAIIGGENGAPTADQRFLAELAMILHEEEEAKKKQNEQQQDQQHQFQQQEPNHHQKHEQSLLIAQKKLANDAESTEGDAEIGKSFSLSEKAVPPDTLPSASGTDSAANDTNQNINPSMQLQNEKQALHDSKQLAKIDSSNIAADKTIQDDSEIDESSDQLTPDNEPQSSIEKSTESMNDDEQLSRKIVLKESTAMDAPIDAKSIVLKKSVPFNHSGQSSPPNPPNQTSPQPLTKTWLGSPPIKDPNHLRDNPIEEPEAEFAFGKDKIDETIDTTLTNTPTKQPHQDNITGPLAVTSESPPQHDEMNAATEEQQDSHSVLEHATSSSPEAGTEPVAWSLQLDANCDTEIPQHVPEGESQNSDEMESLVSSAPSMSQQVDSQLQTQISGIERVASSGTGVSQLETNDSNAVLPLKHNQPLPVSDIPESPPAGLENETVGSDVSNGPNQDGVEVSSGTEALGYALLPTKAETNRVPATQLRRIEDDDSNNQSEQVLSKTPGGHYLSDEGDERTRTSARGKQVAVDREASPDNLHLQTIEGEDNGVSHQTADETTDLVVSVTAEQRIREARHQQLESTGGLDSAMDQSDGCISSVGFLRTAVAQVDDGNNVANKAQKNAVDHIVQPLIMETANSNTKQGSLGEETPVEVEHASTLLSQTTDKSLQDRMIPGKMYRPSNSLENLDRNEISNEMASQKESSNTHGTFDNPPDPTSPGVFEDTLTENLIEPTKPLVEGCISGPSGRDGAASETLSELLRMSSASACSSTDIEEQGKGGEETMSDLLRPSPSESFGDFTEFCDHGDSGGDNVKTDTSIEYSTTSIPPESLVPAEESVRIGGLEPSQETTEKHDAKVSEASAAIENETETISNTEGAGEAMKGKFSLNAPKEETPRSMEIGQEELIVVDNFLSLGAGAQKSTDQGENVAEQRVQLRNREGIPMAVSSTTSLECSSSRDLKAREQPESPTRKQQECGSFEGDTTSVSQVVVEGKPIIASRVPLNGGDKGGLASTIGMNNQASEKKATAFDSPQKKPLENATAGNDDTCLVDEAGGGNQATSGFNRQQESGLGDTEEENSNEKKHIDIVGSCISGESTNITAEVNVNRKPQSILNSVEENLSGVPAWFAVEKQGDEPTKASKGSIKSPEYIIESARGGGDVVNQCGPDKKPSVHVQDCSELDLTVEAIMSHEEKAEDDSERLLSEGGNMQQTLPTHVKTNDDSRRVPREENNEANGVSTNHIPVPRKDSKPFFSPHQIPVENIFEEFNDIKSSFQRLVAATSSTASTVAEVGQPVLSSTAITVNKVAAPALTEAGQIVASSATGLFNTCRHELSRRRSERKLLLSFVHDQNDGGPPAESHRERKDQIGRRQDEVKDLNNSAARTAACAILEGEREVDKTTVSSRIAFSSGSDIEQYRDDVARFLVDASFNESTTSIDSHSNRHHFKVVDDPILKAAATGAEARKKREWAEHENGRELFFSVQRLRDFTASAISTATAAASPTFQDVKVTASEIAGFGSKNAPEEEIVVISESAVSDISIRLREGQRVFRAKGVNFAKNRRAQPEPSYKYNANRDNHNREFHGTAFEALASTLASNSNHDKTGTAFGNPSSLKLDIQRPLQEGIQKLKNQKSLMSSLTENPVIGDPIANYSSSVFENERKQEDTSSISSPGSPGPVSISSSGDDGRSKAEDSFSTMASPLRGFPVSSGTVKAASFWDMVPESNVNGKLFQKDKKQLQGSLNCSSRMSDNVKPTVAVSFGAIPNQENGPPDIVRGSGIFPSPPPMETHVEHPDESERSGPSKSAGRSGLLLSELKGTEEEDSVEEADFVDNECDRMEAVDIDEATQHAAKLPPDRTNAEPNKDRKTAKEGVQTRSKRASVTTVTPLPATAKGLRELQRLADDSNLEAKSMVEKLKAASATASGMGNINSSSSEQNATIELGEAGTEKETSMDARVPPVDQPLGGAELTGEKDTPKMKEKERLVETSLDQNESALHPDIETPGTVIIGNGGTGQQYQRDNGSEHLPTLRAVRSADLEFDDTDSISLMGYISLPSPHFHESLPSPHLHENTSRSPTKARRSLAREQVGSPQGSVNWAVSSLAGVGSLVGNSSFSEHRRGSVLSSRKRAKGKRGLNKRLSSRRILDESFSTLREHPTGEMPVPQLRHSFSESNLFSLYHDREPEPRISFQSGLSTEMDDISGVEDLGGMLDLALMSFSSFTPPTVYAHVSEPPRPEPLRYFASVRWRQLIAHWKHYALAKAVTERACSLHYQQDSDDDASSVNEESTASTGAAKDKKGALDFLKHHTHVYLHDATKNWNGLVPQLTDGEMPALTRFLIDFGCDRRANSRQKKVAHFTLRHSLPPGKESATSASAITELATPYMERFSTVVKDIVHFASQNYVPVSYENEHELSYSIGIKSKQMIEKKANLKYNGDILQVKDVLRSQITFGDEGALVAGLRKLQKLCSKRDARSFVEIARVKNLFGQNSSGELCAPSLPTGYRHVLVNIRFDGLLLAEIQFQLESFFLVLGYEGYNLHREVLELEEACSFSRARVREDQAKATGSESTMLKTAPPDAGLNTESGPIDHSKEETLQKTPPFQSNPTKDPADNTLERKPSNGEPLCSSTINQDADENKDNNETVGSDSRSIQLIDGDNRMDQLDTLRNLAIPYDREQILSAIQWHAIEVTTSGTRDIAHFFVLHQLSLIRIGVRRQNAHIWASTLRPTSNIGLKPFQEEVGLTSGFKKEEAGIDANTKETIKQTNGGEKTLETDAMQDQTTNRANVLSAADEVNGNREAQGNNKGTVENKGSRKSRFSNCCQSLVISRDCLLRSLVISNQGTSVGMTGWLEYGADNSFGRLIGAPFTVLRDLALSFAIEKDWKNSMDVLHALLIRCDQYLPMYHPTTLAAILDAAGVARAASLRKLERSHTFEVSRRLSFYLSEQEANFFSKLEMVWGEDPCGLGLVCQFQEGSDVISMLANFAEQLQASFSSGVVQRLGIDETEEFRDISLVHHFVVGDSLSVLANCSLALETLVVPPPNQSVRKKDSIRYWRTAFLHYENLFKGLVRKSRPLSDEMVVAAAYGMARCLKNLGQRTKALDVLSLIVSALGRCTESRKVTVDGNESHSFINSSSRHESNVAACITPNREGAFKSIFLSAQNEDGEYGGNQRAHRSMALCLWLMAVISVEENPNERGRMRALSLLHAASEGLQSAILPSDAPPVTDIPGVFSSSKECQMLLRRIEQEARDLLEPLEASAESASAFSQNQNATNENSGVLV